MPELLTIVVSVILGLFTNEISDNIPRLARAIVGWCAQRMPSTERERYKQEHLAVLHTIPGKLGQLHYAVSLASSVDAQRKILEEPKRVPHGWRQLLRERILPRLPQGGMEWSFATFSGVAQLLMMLNTIIVGSPAPKSFTIIGFAFPMLLCFGAAAVIWSVRLHELFATRRSAQGATLESWGRAGNRVVGGTTLVSFGILTIGVVTFATIFRTDWTQLFSLWANISMVLLPNFAFQTIALQRIPTRTAFKIPLLIVQRVVSIAVLGYLMFTLYTIVATLAKTV